MTDFRKRVEKLERSPVDPLALADCRREFLESGRWVGPARIIEAAKGLQADLDAMRRSVRGPPAMDSTLDEPLR